MREKAIRLLMSLAVMAALGFGAKQAFATNSPLPGYPGGACYGPTCDYYCVTTMKTNVGFCLNGTCVCRNVP